MELLSRTLHFVMKVKKEWKCISTSSTRIPPCLTLPSLRAFKIYTSLFCTGTPLENIFGELYEKRNTQCRKNAEFCNYTAGGTQCHQCVMSPSETSWKVGRPSIKKEPGMWH